MQKQSDEDQWESLPQSFGNPNATEILQQSYYQQGEELIPSAPPLIAARDPNRNVYEDILHMEPPEWLRDSFAPNCGLCQQSFQAIMRSRHHCRMCGRIFCHQCCHKSCCFPPRYREREPQRVCQICAPMLQPYQAYLAGCITKAARAPIFDVMDSTALRSWINNPINYSLENDIYKATNVLHQFIRANYLQGEIGPSKSVLKNAQGFAIMSYVRVGAGWSYAVGTGLLIAKKNDYEWSAPCSLGCAKIGSGFQAGAEVVDLLLVIKTRNALENFCGPVEVGLGGNASLSFGPLGRSSNASIMLGKKGTTTVYSYSITKGLFVGLSMEGTLFVPNQSCNDNFYGQTFTPKQLLFDNVTSRPRACAHLYQALDVLVNRNSEQSIGISNGQLPQVSMQYLPESSLQQQQLQQHNSLYPIVGVPSSQRELVNQQFAEDQSIDDANSSHNDLIQVGSQSQQQPVQKGMYLQGNSQQQNDMLMTTESLKSSQGYVQYLQQDNNANNLSNGVQNKQQRQNANNDNESQNEEDDYDFSLFD